MKFDKRHYLLRVGDLLSQALNTIVFNGQTDESTSARAYRQGTLYGERKWLFMQKFIDFLFSWYEKDHCKKAYYTDRERAKIRLSKTNKSPDVSE